MTEETLFELAVRTPTEERMALLDRACLGKPDLRARVDATLLRGKLDWMVMKCLEKQRALIIDER